MLIIIFSLLTLLVVCLFFYMTKISRFSKNNGAQKATLLELSQTKNELNNLKKKLKNATKKEQLLLKEYKNLKDLFIKNNENEFIKISFFTEIISMLNELSNKDKINEVLQELNKIEKLICHYFCAKDVIISVSRQTDFLLKSSNADKQLVANIKNDINKMWATIGLFNKIDTLKSDSYFYRFIFDDETNLGGKLPLALVAIKDPQNLDNVNSYFIELISILRSPLIKSFHTNKTNKIFLELEKLKLKYINEPDLHKLNDSLINNFFGDFKSFIDQNTCVNLKSFFCEYYGKEREFRSTSIDPLDGYANEFPEILLSLKKTLKEILNNIDDITKIEINSLFFNIFKIINTENNLLIWPIIISENYTFKIIGFLQTEKKDPNWVLREHEISFIFDVCTYIEDILFFFFIPHIRKRWIKKKLKELILSNPIAAISRFNTLKHMLTQTHKDWFWKHTINSFSKSLTIGNLKPKDICVLFENYFESTNKLQYVEFFNLFKTILNLDIPHIKLLDLGLSFTKTTRNISLLGKERSIYFKNLIEYLISKPELLPIKNVFFAIYEEIIGQTTSKDHATFLLKHRKEISLHQCLHKLDKKFLEKFKKGTKTSKEVDVLLEKIDEDKEKTKLMFSIDTLNSSIWAKRACAFFDLDLLTNDLLILPEAERNSVLITIETILRENFQRNHIEEINNRNKYLFPISLNLNINNIDKILYGFRPFHNTSSIRIYFTSFSSTNRQDLNKIINLMTERARFLNYT